jgi:integrase
MARLDREAEVRKAIAGAVVPEGKRDCLIFDSGYPKAIRGFGIRVFKSGRAFFFLKYAAGRQTRRVSLGEVDFTETRDGQVKAGNLQRMREWAVKVKDNARVLGQDIIEERKTKEAAKRATAHAALNAPTLRKLAPQYLRDRERGKNDDGRELKKLKAKSLHETARYLSGSKWTPSVWEPIADMPLADITMRRLHDIITETARTKGSITADRSRVALSGFFAWCIELRLVDANPTNDLAAQSLSKPRERVLAEAELIEIWRACEDNDFGTIVKLLMLSGCRRSEVGDLGWPEIDLDRRRIELPPHRCKNGHELLLPLSDEAVSVIEGIPRDEARSLLFGSGAGGYSGWSKSKAQLDQRIRDARTRDGRGPMAPWRLHDIRRSVVTHLLESRERKNEKGETESYAFSSPHIVEGIINHISGHRASVAGIYNKAQYFAEKRDALQRWAGHLSTLLAAPPLITNQRVETRNKRISRKEAARVTIG